MRVSVQEPPAEAFTLESPTDGLSVLSASAGSSPLRLAYADPPYYGLAAKFYGKMHPDAAEYDKLETHAALIKRMCADYDGWAMSLQSPALKHILPLCPDDARVMAWVKPFASFKPGVKSAQHAWEPVIVWRGRPFTGNHCVRDWHSCGITLQRGFQGAKPASLVRWILTVLNAEKTDTIDDLFPGSGAVGREIEAWKSERFLWETNDQAHGTAGSGNQPQTH